MIQSKLNKTRIFLGYLLLFLSFLIVFLTYWIKHAFTININGFETILVTLTMPLDGTDPEVIKAGTKFCLSWTLRSFLVSVLCIELFNLIKKENIIKKIFQYIRRHLLLLSSICVVLSIAYFLYQFDFISYLKSQNVKSTIYEEKYIDPRNINFTFPEKKRNLVFIYLESMETSFYSKQEGGALENNVIPELYELSKEGITFTDINNQGYYVAPRSDYTLGSDIATTSGVTLSTAFIHNFLTSKNVLPGTYTLGDVLKNNGYRNVMMLGSLITFAGTDNYYSSHGNYEYKDYQYAIDKGYIPQDYKMFWGYEDKKLFQFARKELLEIAQSNQPFNFTLKTIDTHNPGYICEDCEKKYDLDYLNALSCSSRQVYEFINWIKNQPFYENTTIVLIGDHISMDTTTVSLIDSNYIRKPYFVILNSVIPTINNNRKISTVDIYPTILASMGVTYNSDRLGLGTNLYSNTKTLLEEMGENFFNELNKSSDYYNKHLIRNNWN